MTRLVLLLLTAFIGTAFAAERNAFFAMDTIARGGAEKVVPMLKELGYDGLGGAPGDAKMAAALKNAGLRFYNGYITLAFSHAKSPLDDPLKRRIDAMQGYEAALWLAISRVETEAGPARNSSEDGDAVAIAAIREIADYASTRGVKIALYPHTASWLERVEDAVRLANKLNRADIGATFNLCHWLKVEGPERNPEPVLRAALPRLMFVTINGADTGATKSMGWDRLIQPLGRGTYDTAAFMKTLASVGYKGPIGFQGFGIREEPHAVLKETMEAWRRMNP